ncbi:MAG: lysophospholipid acyltransferase family protein [Treponema sp.]|nr:1-acyl-sn-glycerol-3-phosphate acyltransferase [Spirochaetia bacterium]MDD7534389.1 lysophospholipid acyltransferase family protein [Treponema sp.]MDY5758357.1 lysophospholipid acyltransferase family protein [Treponema sp.]
MSSFLTLVCLFSMVIPASIANIFAYPVSRKLSVRISNYIVRVLAPRLFAILRKYRKFNFWGYDDKKNELPEDFIIISNHQSLLDIPVFMKYFPDKEVRFIAKDALGRHVPLVSEMLRAQEHCLIPRKAKPMEAMRYISDFGKRVIERKQIPILFPEGSRTHDGNVGKFFSAGFRQLTESTGLPVVVCALDGGWKLRDLRKLMTNLKHGCYRVKVLRVYEPPKTKEECNKILEESKLLMQQQIEYWRQLPANKK